MANDTDIQLVEQELFKSVPTSRWLYVDVTFNTTANADTDVTHTLNTTAVDYLVVGWSFGTAPATIPVIYRDSSGTARPWGKNYLILRCNVALAKATLLLTSRRAT